MAGRTRGQRNIAHQMRHSAQKALEQAYNAGGIEALKLCWLDVLKSEGPAKFLDTLRHYVPKELNIESDSPTVFVVGAPPENAEAWLEQHARGEEIIIDGEAERAELPAPDAAPKH